MTPSSVAAPRAATSSVPGLDRTVALVGMMGVGKTSIGRRVAAALGWAFRDADEAVEEAAGCSISDIFTDLGEPAFRDGERRVIARLLGDPPHVLATGGGAFMNAETRALLLERAVVVWLKADLDVLVRRVSRKDTRPLLRDRDPAEVLGALIEVRHPVYAQAHVTVETGDVSHGVSVEAVLNALRRWCAP